MYNVIISTIMATAVKVFNPEVDFFIVQILILLLLMNVDKDMR